MYNSLGDDMKQFVINQNDSGQRVDKFLQKAVPDLPKSLMYKYIRLKRIKLNRKRCEISTRLNSGDVLELYINDEFFAQSRQKHAFMSAPAEAFIVFEDENILICDKPSGLVVHEDESGGADTLINRVLRCLYERGAFDPDMENSFAPALCNRIDRNTQGLVICAKTAQALRIMNEKIKNREIEKEYLCVCIGIPNEKKAEIKAFSRRDKKNKTVTVSDKPLPDGKTMVTRYEVIAENKQENLSLLRVRLITGRTHQIRAHMAHIGYPLLGDGKYGINRVNREYNVKTQALCSYRLTFCFMGDSGCLEDLNGRTFTASQPWFVKKWFPESGKMV